MSAKEIVNDDEIVKLAGSVKRVAVLGIKTEAQRTEAAFYVPAYLAGAGVEVVPVPVYYPEAREILGQPVYRSVAEVPGVIDLVDVFRKPSDLDAHLADLLAAKPAAVWLQQGIRHDTFARRLVAAGINVVQDRCLMVDHRRAKGRR